ncbi:MAG: hypothetical protein HY402_03870 [Elusimicrobia bacterium]|nr:hypothetical protein [Elusimicrobiota bacterium]
MIDGILTDWILWASLTAALGFGLVFLKLYGLYQSSEEPARSPDLVEEEISSPPPLESPDPLDQPEGPDPVESRADGPSPAATLLRNLDRRLENLESSLRHLTQILEKLDSKISSAPAPSAPLEFSPGSLQKDPNLIGESSQSEAERKFDFEL